MAEHEIFFISKDHWEVALKIIGPVLGAAVTYSQRRFFARPRAKLRSDLELLKLMEGDALTEQRATLQHSVAAQVDKIYCRCVAHKRNFAIVAFGLIWALAFIAVTYYIFKNDDELSKWWTLLSGWMALAGLGWMIMGWEGKFRSSSDDAATVSEGVPGKRTPPMRGQANEHETPARNSPAT